MRCECYWDTCHCRQCNNTGCCTTMFLGKIYVAGNNKTYLSLQAKCPTFLSDFNRSWNYSAEFYKAPDIKVHGHPPNGSRTDNMRTTDGRTDKQMDTRTGRSYHCKRRSPLYDLALSKTRESSAPIWNTRTFEMRRCGDFVPCFMGLIVHWYCLLKIQIIQMSVYCFIAIKIKVTNNTIVNRTLALH
jgi:hypothetical protein